MKTTVQLLAQLIQVPGSTTTPMRGSECCVVAQHKLNHSAHSLTKSLSLTVNAVSQPVFCLYTLCGHNYVDMAPKKLVFRFRDLF